MYVNLPRVANERNTIAKETERWQRKSFNLQPESWGKISWLFRSVIIKNFTYVPWSLMKIPLLFAKKLHETIQLDRNLLDWVLVVKNEKTNDEKRLQTIMKSRSAYQSCAIGTFLSAAFFAIPRDFRPLLTSVSCECASHFSNISWLWHTVFGVLSQWIIFVRAKNHNTTSTHMCSSTSFLSGDSIAQSRGSQRLKVDKNWISCLIEGLQNFWCFR